MKKFICTIIGILLIVQLLINVYAADNVSIIRAVISDVQISTYVSADDIADCTVFIGTSECKINSYTKSGDLPSNTLILIDASGSMPKDMRSKVGEFLAALIDGKQENESYSISLIGTETTYLCDYTTDRYELSRAIEGLEYNQKYTNIYSALDEALANLPADTFGKIVIISDGKENNKDGITYDEILKTVSEKNCPIYTVGLESDNQEKLKRFYAFSRNSSARSYTLTADSNVSEICDIINETRDYTCIDIEIPDGAADGSMKYLKISGNGFECGSDVRMPVIAAKEKQTEETTTAVIAITEATAVSASNSDKDNNNNVIPIVVICMAAIIVVSTLIVLLVKSKKKEWLAVISRPQKTSENDKTKIDTKESGNVPTTIESRYVIKLTDVNAPEHSFRCALGQGVIIGRNSEQSMIVIDYDGYVARRHCRIWREKGKFYIENFSKNNVVINDKVIVEKPGEEPKPSPSGGTRILIPNAVSNHYAKEVSDGDILKIGHTRLKLEIIGKG